MVLHVSSSSSLLPTNNQPPSTPVPRLGLLATLELSWELPKVPEPQTLASFSARPLRRPHHRRPHRRPAHPAVPSLCDVARQPKSIAPTDTGSTTSSTASFRRAAHSPSAVTITCEAATAVHFEPGLPFFNTGSHLHLLFNIAALARSPFSVEMR